MKILFVNLWRGAALRVKRRVASITMAGNREAKAQSGISKAKAMIRRQNLRRERIEWVVLALLGLATICLLHGHQPPAEPDMTREVSHR